MTKFVNPYTFLPLPDSIKREQLQMHDGSGAQDRELYTGSFTVEWELKSPLLLPEKAEEEGWLELTGNNRGKIRVPGSSVKGAMRSLHEALFFGCMSVVDQDYIPVYREASVKGQRTDSADWVIGVVEKVDDDGRPISIRRTVRTDDTDGKTMWINAEGLLRACRRQSENELPQTGDIVRFRNSDVVVKNNRAKVYEPREFAPRRDGNIDTYSTNDYVIIITDGGTRKKMRAWHWASRKIDIYADALPVSDEVWKHFEAKVDGTDDLRRERLEIKKGKLQGHSARKIQVEGLGKVLGKRLSQNGMFSPGDALWVRIAKVEDKEQITELSYSAIWRRVAVFPEGSEKSGEVMHLGDLLGDLSPCDPNDEEHGVCLSCSLFGAVGPEKEKGEKGLGYAGHVRFGSLELKCGAADVSAEKEIMPLSSPKPSNGQFYMTNPRRLQGEPTPDMAYEGETTSHWDRREMKNVERKPAGRKFYWNHDPLYPHHGRRHYEKFDGVKDELITKRRFVSVGDDSDSTVFKSEVTFDQITGAQLASLWCLLNPVSLFKSFNISGPEVPVVRLGGGKPLGFGSVAPRISSYHIFRSKERYCDDAPEFDSDKQSSPDHALGMTGDGWSHFVKAIEERVITDGTRKKLVDNVKTLARLMDLDGLGAMKEFVTYPPNASWEQYGTKKFHESYRFFVENRGAAGGGNNGTYWGEWKPLPVLKPADYSQPLRDDQTLDW